MQSLLIGQLSQVSIFQHHCLLAGLFEIDDRPRELAESADLFDLSQAVPRMIDAAALGS